MVLGSVLLAASSIASAAPPLPLHVSGTRILDSNGRQVLLRGVNCASMEWTSDGEGHILATVRTAIDDWHANIIRLPVSQDRWFGLEPEQHDGGDAYRSLVHRVIDTIASDGCYAVLDLHWNDAGTWGPETGQHVMPDENSVTFWRSAARAYRNDPAVIFDLYNEPHDVSWDVWKNGGVVQDRGPTVRHPTSYRTPGMQSLLVTVRSQGADNMVIAGGLDWAYDMSGFLKGFTLSDPDGSGVVYANHSYPIKGDTIQKWLAKMEAATAKIPVIVSEFGSETRPPRPNARPNRFNDPKWLPETMAALHSHHWNWIAWDLHPSAGPRLISDWEYTPTPSFGAIVKKELATRQSP